MDAILRKRLKTWQKEFRQKNGGREPKRSDIAKVPEIASIYETWTALNTAANPNGQGESQSQQTKAKGKQREISRSTSNHKTSSSQKSQPPLPTTPTKSKPSTDNTFKTPTKAASSSTLPAAAGASPSTPRRTPAASSSRNPFKTPTKPTHSASPSLPATPSSAVKLRTPRPDTQASPTNRDGTTITKIDPSFHFDYNTSPSSFRTLIGQHSSSHSPNRRRPTTSSSSIDADVQKLYTPRTKARKRLRGDEVPVTPQSAGQEHAVQMGATASPSKSRTSASQQQTATLQPGPVDPRPRKRRAERALSAYWGAGTQDGREDADKSTTASTKNSRFGRTVSQPQPMLSMALDDDNDEALLQASPSTGTRSDRRQPPILPPSSPLARKRTQGQPTSSTSRKFQSLFDEPVEDAAPLHQQSMAVDDDDETEQLHVDSATPSDARMTAASKPHPSAVTRAKPPLPAASSQEILLTDLSSSSESEDERRGKKSGRSSLRSTRPLAKSASPSKAAFVRTYRRLGAMSLSRHNSSSQAFPDSDSEAEDDISSNPARLFAVSKAQHENRSQNHSETADVQEPLAMRIADDDDGKKIAASTASKSAAVDYSRLLNYQPRALRTLQQAQQLQASSVLSNLGLLDEHDPDSIEPTSITLENAESALGVKIERSGFKACAEGQEGQGTAAINSRQSSNAKTTWGAAKAANKSMSGNVKKGSRKSFGNVNADAGTEDASSQGSSNLLGRAKRGWGASLGTFVGSDEEGDEDKETKLARKGHGQPTLSSRLRTAVFKRAGRSGVDDDESVYPAHVAARRRAAASLRKQEFDDDTAQSDNSATDPHASSALRADDDDDDWQSDVDSVDWGVGDGRMDDDDVL